MRRLILLSLAVMMMVGLTAGSVSATGALFTLSPDFDFKSTAITLGSSDDADQDNTVAISTSTITTRNRILGFSITTSAAAAVSVGLYDGDATTDATTANVIAEHGCAAYGSDTLWFPMPKTISNGVVIYGSNDAIQVTVYYI
jgi:hypothetical protein